MAANRQGGDKLFAYGYAQGNAGRAIPPEELFHPRSKVLT